MLGKLRESRWVFILLSIILAVIFWAYVRGVVDPDDSTTLHNVRLEVTGTRQGLTVSGLSQETVDLHVEAPSSVINNLVRYREDIYVPLDVSRCTEGENRVTVGQPVWPTNFNTDEVVLQGKEPGVITVEVDRLYTNTFEVEFQLDGQVADGYQMGTPAIEPEMVTVSGPVEQVNRIAHVVAVLESEELSEQFSGDLPLTLWDAEGNELTDLEITLNTETAYVVVPVVVVKEVPLTVEVKAGGGATPQDAVVTIDPLTVTVSGQEEDIQELTEISLGEINLATVVGTNTFQLPITLDASLENVSGEMSATVTVSVQGLSTTALDVDNITMSPAPDGYTATLVTHVKEVVIRGKEEDLAAINASQIRIVADLSNVTTTGMLSVPARVYLDASSAVGVIGEYTVVVNVER